MFLKTSAEWLNQRRSWECLGPKVRNYGTLETWIGFFSLVTIFAKIGGKYLTFWSCQIIRKKTLKNEIISKITIIHGI